MMACGFSASGALPAATWDELPHVKGTVMGMASGLCTLSLLLEEGVSLGLP